MADKNGSKMGLGLVIGMVVGTLGGIFLAPKSGKENRDAVAKKMNEMKDMMNNGEMQEKVEQIFGDLSEDSFRLYNNVREGVMKGIEDVKNMDADDYGRMVQNVVDKVKEGSKMSADTLMKLKEDMIKQWPAMKEEVETKKKKVQKKASKDDKDDDKK